MRAKKDEEIRFKASLHPTSAALSFYAGGDARLVLAVDSGELPSVAKVLLLEGKVFTIVIPRSQVENPQKTGNGKARKVYR